MAADNLIAISLNEAKFTSVVLTGVRGSGIGTSTAVLSLSNGGVTTTYSATMSSGETTKDFEVTGLSPETTYTITGTGDFDSNTSITEVTTLVDSPRVATISQWEDLANRVKAAGGATETYTIAVADWQAATGVSPYAYSATVTATYAIGANTLVELYNDDPVAFANYGFAIESISGQVLTIYALDVPTTATTLKVNYKETA